MQPQQRKKIPCFRRQKSKTTASSSQPTNVAYPSSEYQNIRPRSQQQNIQSEHLYDNRTTIPHSSHNPQYSSFTQLLNENDRRNDFQMSAQQLADRDREVTRNLSRQFSSYQNISTEYDDMNEIEEGNDIEEEGDDFDEEDDEEVPETQLPHTPEFQTFFAQNKGKTNVGEASGRKRRVRFTHPQLMSVAKAWLRISTDNITGTNMNGPKFWQKVADFYNTWEPVQRSWQSVRGGYRTLNKACQKWLAIVTGLQRRTMSGANDGDYVSILLITF